MRMGGGARMRVVSTLTIKTGVNMDYELQEKRKQELAELPNKEAREHALKQHAWEDEIFDAIDTVWTASANLDNHGFVGYDSGYLIFALEQFKREFEFVNDRDRRHKHDC